MTLWVTIFVTFFPIWHPYAWMIHVSVWVIVAFARAVTVTILRTSSITCRTNENIQYQSGWTISYDIKKKNGKYSVLYTTEWLNYITRCNKKGSIQWYIQRSGWTISHDVKKKIIIILESGLKAWWDNNTSPGKKLSKLYTELSAF